MGESSLKCFGVGDGWPCADRHHSSTFYQLGPAGLLIDCGEPISSSLQRSGLAPDCFDALLLSHLHSDHLGGLFMLLQGLWLEKRTKPLPFHLPAEGIEPIRQMLRACYLFDEFLSFGLEFHPLVAGQPIVVAGARVTPFATTHLDATRNRFQSKYPQAFAAFGFVLEAEGRRVIHSADLGAPEDLTPLLDEPVDLLVCELAHFAPKALFGFLRGRPVRRLVLTHLARHHWENLETARQLATRLLGDLPVSFARDGEEFQF